MSLASASEYSGVESFVHTLVTRLRLHWSEEMSDGSPVISVEPPEILEYPPEIRSVGSGGRLPSTELAVRSALSTAAACLPRPSPGSLAQKVPSAFGLVGPAKSDHPGLFMSKAHTESDGFRKQLVATSSWSPSMWKPPWTRILSSYQTPAEPNRAGMSGTAISS